MQSKTAIFAKQRDNSLTIRRLSQNYLKSRIFAFLGANKVLFEKTRVLEGIKSLHPRRIIPFRKVIPPPEAKGTFT